MATQHEISIRLTADGKGLVGEVRTAGGELRRFGTEGAQAGERAAGGMGKTRQALSSVSEQLREARNAFIAVFSVREISRVLSQTIQVADAIGQMDSRLQMATASQAEFNFAQSRLEDISRRSYRAIAETSEVFLRSIGPMRELGYATGEVLDMTEAVSLSLVVSATNAQTGTSVIEQFGKAMELGALRGDQFNTVIAGSPRLAQALAEGLGVTRQELRLMAEAGQLTTDVVLPALSGQLAALRAEAENMPITVEDAMVRLRDSFGRFVADANKSTGATVSLAQGIDALANHIDVLMYAAGTLVALLVGRGVSALVQWTARKHAAAAATWTFNLSLQGTAAAATAAGRSMLAFVGGPVGIAIMALGVLAAVTLTARHREEERRRAMEASLQETRDLTGEVEALNQALRDHASIAPPSFDEVWRRSGEAASALADQFRDVRIGSQVFADIEQLTSRAAFLRDALGAEAYRGFEDEIRDELAAIEAQLNAYYRLRAEYGELADELERRLTPAMQASVDSLVSLTQAASVRDVWAALTGAVSGFRAELDLMRQADADFKASSTALQALDSDAQKAIETFGKTKVALAEMWAAQRIEAAQAQGASAQRLADIRAENDAMIERVRTAEQMGDAHKKATQAHANAVSTLSSVFAEMQGRYDEGAAILARYAEIEGTLTALVGDERVNQEELAQALEWVARARQDDLANADKGAARAKANAAAADSYRRSLRELSAQLAGPAAVAQMRYQEALDEMREAFFEGIISADDAAEAQKLFTEELERALKQIEENSDGARELESILGRYDDLGFSGLVREIELVGEALEEATDPAQIERLQRAMGHLRHEMVTGIVGASQEGLRSLQSMSSEGSDAFKAMQVAIDALTVVQAISAVLNQGLGDPYTAFARMAAMAAAVGQLVGSIGSFSGGFSDTAGQRQATQGRGTVLGDAEAQSASIENATQITADATSALVGINRGMLRALLQMQQSIGAATAMLARGGRTAEFSDLPAAGRFRDVLPGGLGNIFRDPLNLLGGSSRITDEGIVIFGGALTEMLEGIALGAYQEVQTRRWRFGSRRTTEEVVPVTGELERQFSLIIASIVDTVRAGALALGLLPSEIEEAIAAFRVEEIRISMMDLNADEQQAELLAVFGTIFDGLAGHVVTWLPQFQAVGEGLGETLVRVATSVQVTQEAMRYLGLAIDEADPERFAQISVALIELAGGIDEFISGMLNFVERFAPESHRFEVAQSALTDAFEQAGLAIPATREAMWDLMQSLDATTEEGRAQIAMLLQVADAADAYYRALEDQGRELERQAAALVDYQLAVSDLQDELDAAHMSGFQLQLRDIARWAEDASASLNATAQAAGMQAAAEEDLALVHQVAAQRVAQAIRQLQNAARSLVERLYGSELEQIESQITALGGNVAQSQLDGIASVGQAADEMYRRQLQAIQNIQQWLDQQLLGDLSTLTPEQRLAEARAQFEAMSAAAAAGDVDAMAALPQLASQLLREGRDFWASSQDYTDLEAFVRGVMQGFAGMDIGTAPVGSGTGGGAVGVSPELQQLYEERDRLLAQIEEDSRRALAEDLTLMIRDLVAATRDSLDTVAASIGVNLTDLVADLGINLDEMTVATALQLADVARLMGVNLADLATQVGFDLGALGDRQSLLNQALDSTLSTIPDEFRERLLGPLDALRNAVTETDVNDAMFDLLSVTDELPAGIRDLLAPFFAEIDPSQMVTELSTLRDVKDIVSDQLDVLSEIRAVDGEVLAKMSSVADNSHQASFILELILENLRAQNSEANIPQYESGTGYVPRTGLALLHRGESVIPAPFNAWLQQHGFPVGAGGNMSGVEQRLDRLTEVTERRLASVERGLAEVARAERDTGEQIDRASRRGRDAGLAVRG